MTKDLTDPWCLFCLEDSGILFSKSLKESKKLRVSYFKDRRRILRVPNDFKEFEGILETTSLFFENARRYLKNEERSWSL